MAAIDDLLTHQFVERLGWTLFHFLWQGALIALILLVALRILRRFSSNVRYLAAGFALMSMAIVPVVTFMITGNAKAKAAVSSFSPNPSPVSIILNSPPSGAASVTQVPIPYPTAIREVDSRPRIIKIRNMLADQLRWLVLGWIAGVSILSLRLLGGWWRMRQLVRSAIQPAADRWIICMKELARQLKISRPILLLQSALAEAPVTIGWLRPVILFPVDAIGRLMPDQVKALLAHELAHIRRYDYLINAMQMIVETLLFYHPAVWWVGKHMRAEREFCCDDLAAKMCGDRVAYANALAGMEALLGAMPRPVLAAGGGPLLERVARLLGKPCVSRRNPFWLAALLALIIALCVLFALRAGAHKTMNANKKADSIKAFLKAINLEHQGAYEADSGILFFGPGQWLSYIRVNGEHESVVTRFADGKTEESALWDKVENLALSPDGRTLTYVGTRGNNSYFVANEKPGPAYAEINISFPRMRTVFSADGKHWACTASRDGRSYFIVHDGIEEVFEADLEPRLFFSPVSGKLIYCAQKRVSPVPPMFKSFLVIDGKPGKEYDEIIGPIQLKADTDEPIYIAQLGKNRCMVVGERQGKFYTNVYFPRVSEDGKTIAYVANIERKSVVVVNDREFGPYECFIPDKDLVMDPDGKRIAYPIGRWCEESKGKTAARLILDGVPSSQAYDQIEDPVLSPPGSPRSRVAFIAIRDPWGRSRSSVVLDGAAGPYYKRTRDLQFSADGSLFYVAEDGSRAFPVYERDPGPAYNEILWFMLREDGKPIFRGLRDGHSYDVRWTGTAWQESPPHDEHVSPIPFDDSGADVYIASRKGQQFLVIGGKEQTHYDEIHDVRYGLDGRSVLAVASRGKRMLLVLDGQEIACEEGIGVLGTPEKYRRTEGRKELRVAAGRVNTFFGRDEYYLQLNDKTIFTYGEIFPEHSPFIGYQGKARDEDVLMLDVSNGDGCPELAVLIAIDPSGASFVSEPFGNCHGAPSVQAFPDRIEIAFGPKSGRWHERWVYRPGGSLTKSSPAGRKRPRRA